jgi:hypothetical protein
MQKLMMVSIPSDPGARVEVWLERGRTRRDLPYFHAVSYRGANELERRSMPAADDESLPVGARRLCSELCAGMGWQPALN